MSGRKAPNQADTGREGEESEVMADGALQQVFSTITQTLTRLEGKLDILSERQTHALLAQATMRSELDQVLAWKKDAEPKLDDLRGFKARLLGIWAACAVAITAIGWGASAWVKQALDQRANEHLAVLQQLIQQQSDRRERAANAEAVGPLGPMRHQ